MNEIGLTEGTREDCIHYLRERIVEALLEVDSDVEYWGMMADRQPYPDPTMEYTRIKRYCEGKRSGLRTALIFVNTVQDAINGNHELDVPHEN